jgi:hypothetical protein
MLDIVITVVKYVGILLTGVCGVVALFLMLGTSKTM